MSDESEQLRRLLEVDDSSVRLQAALTAGTRPAASHVPVLVERCAIEPDFYVREMLTWALVRHPADLTVPRLLAQTTRVEPQAQSQALHTLSKIGDRRALPAITPALLRDPDDHVARTAWRTSSGLVDGDRDPAGARWLSQQLASQLGRGGRDTQASLARAFASVGRAALPVLERSRRAADARVRIHALAVIAQLADPELRFDDAVDEARCASFGAHLARSPDGGPSPR